jgi:protein-tyrosine phosphatase
MVQTGKLQGTPINDLKARQFSTQDFEDFDLIYAMDKANYKEIISKARHERDKQKVLLILNEISPNEDLDVPDPYFNGMDAFKEVYELLDQATEAIKNKILDDKNR